jgi:selenocysteine lyase/cysteine desulfurase
MKKKALNTTMNRRDFMSHSGLLFGASLLSLPHAVTLLAQPGTSPNLPAFNNWDDVRSQFRLNPQLIHMAGFYLASHPAPVREAIERHRRGFDSNALEYHHENAMRCELAAIEAASRYLGVDPAGIAMTDSTTMGLGLIYNSIQLEPDHEILTTTHDHYATWRSLELRTERIGASTKQVSLYERGEDASVEEMVDAIVSAITPRTRLIALTWVHSGTGVKVPVADISRELKQINRSREEENQILLSVDGVHGIGVEQESLLELGCDIFVAGTHKWMFGPRGTGLVYATPRARKLLRSTIPPFPPLVFSNLSDEEVENRMTWGMQMSPGGFHSFEHRWAVTEAFAMHEKLGKAAVTSRIHMLNRQIKEGLSSMPHITMHTPMSDHVSAGIVCFEVDGMSPTQVVTRLRERSIVASTTPYAVTYARLSAAIFNTEQEIEQIISAVNELG